MVGPVTRQAQVHYADWKQAAPLQRVQIDPRVPDELNDRCYGRTEQPGVHLLWCSYRVITRL